MQKVVEYFMERMLGARDFRSLLEAKEMLELAKTADFLREKGVDLHCRPE